MLLKMKVKEYIARMLTMRPSVLLRNWMLSVWFSYKKRRSQKERRCIFQLQMRRTEGSRPCYDRNSSFPSFLSGSDGVGSFSNEEQQTGQLTNRHRNKSDSSFLFRFPYCRCFDWTPKPNCDMVYTVHT